MTHVHKSHKSHQKNNNTRDHISWSPVFGHVDLPKNQICYNISLVPFKMRPIVQRQCPSHTPTDEANRSLARDQTAFCYRNSWRLLSSRLDSTEVRLCASKPHTTQSLFYHYRVAVTSRMTRALVTPARPFVGIDSAGDSEPGPQAWLHFKNPILLDF